MKLALSDDSSQYVYQINSLNSTNYCFSPHFAEFIGEKRKTYSKRDRVARDGSLKVELHFEGDSDCTPYQEEKVDVMCKIEFSCFRRMLSDSNTRNLRCDKSSNIEGKKITKQFTLTIGTDKLLKESLQPTIRLSQKYDDFVAKSVCYKE